MHVIVRRAEPRDREDWLRMRDALWPGSLADHDLETQAHFAGGGGDAIVLLAEEDGVALGFLELDRRKYAPGCEDSPVAFIEGWYVEPHARGRGVGKALVDAAEEIAREAGGTEIASDAELDNISSHHAHEALGFEEIERVVCFRKSLRGRA